MNRVEVLATGIKDAFVDALPDNLDDDVRSSISETYEPLSQSIAESIKDYMSEVMEEYVDTRMDEFKTGSGIEVGLTSQNLVDIFTAFTTGRVYMRLNDGRNTYEYRLDTANLLRDMVTHSDTVIKLEGEML